MAKRQRKSTSRRSPAEDDAAQSGEETVSSARPVPCPPVRNKPLLIVSIVLVAAWTTFLAVMAFWD